MANKQPTRAGKDYVRTVPNTWWLKKKTYALFMVRELTCIFVGGYALFLLALVSRAGDEAAFEALLRTPLLIALQIIALPMVLYHSITWINLTPKVMVVFRGEDKVSPALIAGVNYVAWAVVSGVILWIACCKG
jgi:fumarate reductase subunit C